MPAADSAAHWVALQAAQPHRCTAHGSESWPESALVAVHGTGSERDPAASPAIDRGWFFLSLALPAGTYAGQEAGEMKTQEVKNGI